MFITLLLLAACSGDREGSDETPPSNETAETRGEPTDTFPSFYGSVPKNIVMISMDTFRRDYLDRYGDGTVRTPFLSTLAENGVALDNHMTCSNWTYHGVSCTLLGQYNIDAGHIPQLSQDGRAPFPIPTNFLASHLSELGSYNVVGSANTWLGPEWRNTQGYQEHFVGSSSWPMYTEARLRLEAGLNNSGKDQWMLHLHLVDPHAPYVPPSEFLDGLNGVLPLPWDVTIKDNHYNVTRELYPNMSQNERDLLMEHLQVRYSGELEHMDSIIQRIISDLASRGMLDDALVVFWTDHGEQFWEHGFQSHAYTMYREENDGIMFFWAPNIVPASWDGPTSSIDLVPTLLKLQGVDPLPSELTGIPLGEAEDDRARFAFAVARTGAVQMVRQKNWKMTYNWGGAVRLFDLDADPNEQDDLYSPDHPMAQPLFDLLLPKIEAADALLDDRSPSYPNGLER